MAARECTARGEHLLDSARLPSKKRCPKCERMFPAQAFGYRRRKNRSGSTSVTLKTWCRECDRHDARTRMATYPLEQKAANNRRMREHDPRPRTVDRWYTHRGRGLDISLEEYAEHYERVLMGCKPSDWDAWLVSPEQAAHEAWRKWINHDASVEWLTAYWAAHPKPWLRPGLTEAERSRVRYAHDPAFNVRERIKRQFKKLGLGGMSNRRMLRKLGYTADQLREHLERQFLRGMNWDNYGEWHIDHIVPKSSFDLHDPDEVRACWCLSNLRPLWVAENMLKGAKRLHLC